MQIAVNIKLNLFIGSFHLFDYYRILAASHYWKNGSKTNFIKPWFYILSFEQRDTKTDSKMKKKKIQLAKKEPTTENRVKRYNWNHFYFIFHVFFLSFAFIRTKSVLKFNKLNSSMRATHNCVLLLFYHLLFYWVWDWMSLLLGIWFIAGNA